MKHKVSRRSFLKTAAGSGAALAGARRTLWASGAPKTPLQPGLTQWVDVFLGTGGLATSYRLHQLVPPVTGPENAEERALAAGAVEAPKWPTFCGIAHFVAPAPVDG